MNCNDYIELSYSKHWATVGIVASQQGLHFLTSIPLPEPFHEIESDTKNEWFLGVMRKFDGPEIAVAPSK